MPTKKYIVDLSPDEREQLQQLIRRGKTSARKLTRARILLKATDGCTDEEIVAALNIGVSTVERIRKRFVEAGLDAINERPRPGKRPKLGAKAEARLIAEACSKAPDGRQRWTLQLLADRVVQLKLVDSCSYELVRRTLKKTSSSPGSNSNGASEKLIQNLSPVWKMFWICTQSRTTRLARKSTSMKPASS
jgi:transposase